MSRKLLIRDAVRNIFIIAKISIVEMREMTVSTIEGVIAPRNISF